jgi:[ribosomal protein S18]-alanine N-acetyltransferase
MTAVTKHSQMQPIDILSKVIIRPMQEKDIQQVFEIDRLSFALPWSERSYKFGLTENPAARMWVAQLPPEGSLQQIVGMIVLWFIIDEAHIGTIAIHPEHRRRGISRILLLTALDDVRNAGMTRAFLEVRRSNHSAIQLYQSFGFKINGIRPNYYQDNREDALMMTLDESTNS